MSTEQRGIEPAKDKKWEIYKENFLKREYTIADMVEKGEARVEWGEDKNGKPEFVKVFLNDGTPSGNLILFENIEEFKHYNRDSKATRALHKFPDYYD